MGAGRCLSCDSFGWKVSRSHSVGPATHVLTTFVGPVGVGVTGVTGDLLPEGLGGVVLATGAPAVARGLLADEVEGHAGGRPGQSSCRCLGPSGVDRVDPRVQKVSFGLLGRARTRSDVGHPHLLSISGGMPSNATAGSGCGTSLRFRVMPGR